MQGNSGRMRPTTYKCQKRPRMDRGAGSLLVLLGGVSQAFPTDRKLPGPYPRELPLLLSPCSPLSNPLIFTTTPLCLLPPGGPRETAACIDQGSLRESRGKTLVTCFCGGRAVEGAGRKCNATCSPAGNERARSSGPLRDSDVSTHQLHTTGQCWLSPQQSSPYPARMSLGFSVLLPSCVCGREFCALLFTMHC